MKIKNKEPIYNVRTASTNVSTSNKKKKKNNGRNGKPKHFLNIVIKE